ncbi:MAG: HipA domain-containing protein, partial [Desulfuromusa sp.]|nr:HipA domain-containing protein [Desulfuromusa sp.]
MNTEKLLKVWIDGSPVGTLAQEGRKQYVFGYDSRATEGVSLTMPVRLQSWISEDLHPIFQMNLPEGALLEAIRRAIAKISGDDDLSILLATGGNQVGRNSFTSGDERLLATGGKKESLEELLTYPDTKELFHELLNRYALRSGVSGVQPKVLLDATERGTLTSSGYIVKTWGEDYPQLAANEYFCMTAAKKADLPVPEFRLADNGGFFIMRRFDQTADDKSMGFEDMCSLQALGTAQKYRGTYERVAKSLKEFV